MENQTSPFLLPILTSSQKCPHTYLYDTDISAQAFVIVLPPSLQDYQTVKKIQINNYSEISASI